jgi:hypothetical protein
MRVLRRACLLMRSMRSMSASALRSTGGAWCGVAGEASAALRSALKSPYRSCSAAAAPGTAPPPAGASISDGGAARVGAGVPNDERTPAGLPGAPGDGAADDAGGGPERCSASGDGHRPPGVCCWLLATRSCA